MHAYTYTYIYVYIYRCMHVCAYIYRFIYIIYIYMYISQIQTGVLVVLADDFERERRAVVGGNVYTL